MGESEAELNSLLMKVKEESERAGLRQSIKKKNLDYGIRPHYFMANKGGGKVKVLIDFLFFGSKITADADYRHEIRRCLLLDRKVMTNLDSV